MCPSKTTRLPNLPRKVIRRRRKLSYLSLRKERDREAFQVPSSSKRMLLSNIIISAASILQKATHPGLCRRLAGTKYGFLCPGAGVGLD